MDRTVVLAAVVDVRAVVAVVVGAVVVAVAAVVAVGTTGQSERMPVPVIGASWRSPLAVAVAVVGLLRLCWPSSPLISFLFLSPVLFVF